MKIEKTARVVLSRILANAAKEAEYYVKNLELDTFPETEEWTEEVDQHIAIDGWRWEDWDELIAAKEQWESLAVDAAGCEEVHDEWTRLNNALYHIERFVACAGSCTDKFLK